MSGVTMTKTIPEIQRFYDHPYVMHNEWKDLVIFNYTHGCQFDRAWDDVTRAARGIIFNKKTGELWARTWRKFFNLGETEETFLKNLPEGPFSATVKHDGSMGIHFVYDDDHYVVTRGSFVSEQAQWATKWFRKNVDASDMDPEHTYLFEIIYKENRIVVDYGDFEGLILLSCVHKATGHEMDYASLVAQAEKLNVRVTEKAPEFGGIEELYTYCKGLPHSQEGFVVTFANGLKLKMKGEEYCKIHKIIARMTPLAFWEAWDLETQRIPKDFLVQIPEEFRETADALEAWVDEAHMSVAREAEGHYDNLRGMLGPGADKKAMALAAKDKYPQSLSLIMDIYNGKTQKFWDKIHRRVRPTGNVIPDDMAGADRLKRIQEEA